MSRYPAFFIKHVLKLEHLRICFLKKKYEWIMSQREKNLCTVSIAIKLLFILPLLESNVELELNSIRAFIELIAIV